MVSRSLDVFALMPPAPVPSGDLRCGETALLKRELPVAVDVAGKANPSRGLGFSLLRGVSRSALSREEDVDGVSVPLLLELEFAAVIEAIGAADRGATAVDIVVVPVGFEAFLVILFFFLILIFSL